MRQIPILMQLSPSVFTRIIIFISVGKYSTLIYAYTVSSSHNYNHLYNSSSSIVLEKLRENIIRVLYHLRANLQYYGPDQIFFLFSSPLLYTMVHLNELAAFSYSFVILFYYICMCVYSLGIRW